MTIPPPVPRLKLNICDYHERKPYVSSLSSLRNLIQSNRGYPGLVRVRLLYQNQCYTLTMHFTETIIYEYMSSSRDLMRNRYSKITFASYNKECKSENTIRLHTSTCFQIIYCWLQCFLVYLYFEMVPNKNQMMIFFKLRK